MAKRSDFKRIGKDLYRTFDERAVNALLPHISNIRTFSDPFCGHGDLVVQLQDRHGLMCRQKSDVDPMGDLSFGIACDRKEYQNVNSNDLINCDAIISNPPWTRSIMHDAIDHFRQLKQTWFLFDADWCHTAQSARLMRYCSDVVSIGRLRWIKETTMDGKDNCAWYRFTRDEVNTTFHGRR